MLRAHLGDGSGTKKRPGSARKNRGPKRVLTIDQIRSRYKGEWILIKDPVVDKDLRVKKGQVMWHSKDRDEVDRKAIELRLKSSAFLYTGILPKDAAIIL